MQIKTIVVDFSATKISTAQPPIVGPERYEDIKATDGCDAANNFNYDTLDVDCVYIYLNVKFSIFIRPVSMGLHRVS